MTAPTTPPPTPAEEPVFSPAAFVLAWLWPGLGHISLGERRRGLSIMAGVLLLFISGLFIGGIDSVDWENDRLWFYAQALNGPVAFVAGKVNQDYLKGLPPAEQLHTRGIGKANEIGTLYIALAGLMNFIVMLDALHFVPPGSRVRPEDERAEEPAA